VTLKNGAVDQTSKKPCGEIVAAGINTSNLALNQSISRNGNTFSISPLFTQGVGDNLYVSWWLSDRPYDKSNWTENITVGEYVNLSDFAGLSYTPPQAILDKLKGKYLTVQVQYAYTRFNILQPNGLSVLVPRGIGSILVP
jgi:hypothetical protein